MVDEGLEREREKGEDDALRGGRETERDRQEGRLRKRNIQGGGGIGAPGGRF